MTSVAVVVPTIGRPSLLALLRGLADAAGPVTEQILLVDDRRDVRAPLLPADDVPERLPVKVLRGPAAGPAAARNLGWRTADTDWVAFLDDDVLPEPDWWQRLAADLAGCGPDVAATQGRITVPLPTDRRPTDWERNVAGLADAQWATADMAYRGSVLEAVGGFDERFPAAYREDADLGLRTVAAGYRIVRGTRGIVHPVRPAGRWVSVRLQRGNADDVLMRRLHGPRWRADAGVPAGRRPWHLVTTATLVGAAAAAALGRDRAAAALGAAWGVLTADFARRRVAPGPRTRDEVLTMLATSAVLPAAATWHWGRGLVTRRP